MPVGDIRWRGSDDPEVAAARYAIACALAPVVSEFFAEIVNEHRGEDEPVLTPEDQEYRVFMDSETSHNCDDLTLTISMSPGSGDCHVHRADWYKSKLAQKLVPWFNQHPQFPKAELNTLQIDLRFMPMSGCVFSLHTGHLVTSWGDAGWAPETVPTAP